MNLSRRDPLRLVAALRPRTSIDAVWSAAQRDACHETVLSRSLTEPRESPKGGSPGPAAWTPLRSPVRRRAVLAGALAVGAVVTTAVLPHVGSQPAGPGPNATADGARSAPALLLAAAARTETAAPSTVGRYWLAERQIGRLHQVGPAGNRYAVRIRDRHDSWLSTVAADLEGMVTQHLGAAPATAADEAAWKRHGSPANWFSAPPNTRSHPDTERDPRAVFGGISGAPGGVDSYVGADSDLGWSFVTGGKFVSTRQLLAWPAEPAALRKALLDCRPKESDADDTTWLFEAGRQVLMGLPVTPQVRGAVYRILSELSGVRALGAMDDPSGRRGQAIAITNRSIATRHTGPVEEILIFDPTTGTTLSTAQRLLQPQAEAAWAQPGTIWSYEILTSAGWTTRTPPPSSSAPHMYLKADGSVASEEEVSVWLKILKPGVPMPAPPSAPPTPTATTAPR